MLCKIHWRARLLACLIPLIAWTPAFAASNNADQQNLMATLVARLLQNSPEIQAATAQVQAAQSRLKGTGLAINNPQLDVEAEHSDINIFKIGLSQTFDWYDQRSASEQAAQAELAAANAELENLKLQSASALLDTLGKIAASSEIYQLAKRRSRILKHFAQLAQQRFNSGDIPPAELELAKLSLTEAVMQQASSGAELIQLKSDFYSQSGQPLDEIVSIPRDLPSTLAQSLDIEAAATRHPQVQLAHQRALALASRVNVIDRERKANPSFGLNAGKEDSTSTLGVTFSIPLQINNKFQSNVDAARAETLQAEQLAKQAFRSLKGRIDGARQRYLMIAGAWEIWSSQGQDSLQQRSQLLESLWKTGEMSTTDYLIQIQQTLDTQIAGAELQRELWSAWVEWLSSTDQLNDWLQNLSSPSKS